MSRKYPYALWVSKVDHSEEPKCLRLPAADNCVEQMSCCSGIVSHDQRATDKGSRPLNAFLTVEA